jgi:hypothetical protein
MMTRTYGCAALIYTTKQPPDYLPSYLVFGLQSTRKSQLRRSRLPRTCFQALVTLFTKQIETRDLSCD